MSGGAVRAGWFGSVRRVGLEQVKFMLRFRCAQGGWWWASLWEFRVGSKLACGGQGNVATPQTGPTEHKSRRKVWGGSGKELLSIDYSACPLDSRRLVL